MYLRLTTGFIPFVAKSKHDHIGGHMVTIVTAGYILGAPYIIFSHDSAQTNYDPTDSFGLTTFQTYLNDTDFDGVLNVLDVGWTADGPPVPEG